MNDPTPNPLHLREQVLVTAREVVGSARRMLLRRAFDMALSTDRRVYVLGIRRDGRIVMCGRPRCDHTGIPSVMPADHEVELYANDPNYQRPLGAVELRHPAPSIETTGHWFHTTPVALALDWPPTHLTSWWFE